MRASQYDQIADEITRGQLDNGLWMQAYAATDGDERLARAQYIKLRVRKLREARSARPRRFTVGAACLGVAADLWTAWLWAWTFVFATLMTVGLLCLGTLLYLKLNGDGVLAWPFFTVGCAFMTCFLFERGVQRLIERPPTTVFYVVELAALCAALWPVSHLMNPAILGRVPHALSAELVFLVARFLGSGDAWANVLTAAVFFLPVYGVIAFVRQKMI